MESLVADSARFDVFRLVDAALNGQAAQVSRMLAGLRAEGEAVPALLGMVVEGIAARRGAGARAARGGNLAAEFKAQRVWDSKQAVYTRALQRHDAARWERFARRGRHASTASPRAAPRWARIRPMPGSRWNACCWPSPTRARCGCWR